MSAPGVGREIICVNCKRMLFFGGLIWYHRHNDSSFCTMRPSSEGDARRASPLDDNDTIIKQRDELLEALKVMIDLISQERGWGTHRRMEGSELYDDADHARTKALSAIAKATATAKEIA